MSGPKEKPHAGGRGASCKAGLDGRAHVTAMRALYGTPTGRLPDDWRARLPDPASYYAQHVAKLTRTNGTGWAQGVCPFHEDRNASLSVKPSERGMWRCFAGCGGGDLMGFHMRLTGKPFKEAVADLVGWRA